MEGRKKVEGRKEGRKEGRAEGITETYDKSKMVPL